MIVRLTPHGHKVVLRTVVMDEGMHDELQADVTTVGAVVEIQAAYAAWRYVYLRLYDKTFGPRGGKQGATRVEFTALRRITKELNYVDKHPALQGLAMIGLHADLFPVWEIEPSERDPRKYSPYPIPGHQFVVLSPVWYDGQHQTRVTRWVDNVDSPSRLADEHLHLKLWRS